MSTLTKTLLFLCLLLAFVTAASAQTAISAQSIQDFINSVQSGSVPSGQGTPDGVPPSGETICAGQVGAAHGLCTAYCEAMDCDSASPQASSTACAKVRANYLRITGQAGLPCDCPCVNQLPGWIDSVNSTILFCGTSTMEGFIVLETSAPPPFSDPFAAAFNGVGFCGFFPILALPITEQQGMACFNLLQQRAAAAGVTCVS